MTVAKEAWEILETTYEGTKKVKDTKLQMLTTKFKELKMGEDESFDSFYGKLNKLFIAKLNIGEKIEDNKVVRKILRSLSESFQAKVTAIEESKDLDEIKIQELIGSLQMYELGLPSHKTTKSLALKTITKRMDDPSKEDRAEKEVAYLAKNFRKFLKMKNSGKPFNRGKYSSLRGDRKEFTRKEGKDVQSPSDIVYFECNGHGHLKKECPNFLKGKGKAMLSDTDSSNSDSEESCDGEGNYSAFMTIAHVKSSDDLGSLLKELGEYFDLESIGIVKESEAEEEEDTSSLQKNYTLLLEKSGECTKVAKVAVKKMKRVEEDYKSLLVRYKEAKCEIEALNGELSEAYTKVRFLEQEQVLIGITGGSSSSANVTKEVKVVKAKEMAVDKPILEKVKTERKKNVNDQWVVVVNKSRNQSKARFGVRGRSLPRLQ
ncbi:uncharacterized protein LOC136069633 [Quercus suber]|uniref:uncharacterized protein LOC136069633 n=1 Tax=Quercus suber TaxID=58331 RepID=UPI0032DEE7E6